MGTYITSKYLDVLQKHIEGGIPLENMNMTPDQKARTEAVLGTYKRMCANPMMDVDRFLANFYGRTPVEIRNDKKALDFVISLFGEGSKEISRFRIRKTAENVIRMGEASGDWKPMIEGAKMLHKVEELDKPEQGDDLDKRTAILPIVITGDVSKIDRNRHTHSQEEIERIRRKYGGVKDRIMEMVETKEGEFVAAGSVQDNDQESIVTDEDRD